MTNMDKKTACTDLLKTTDSWHSTQIYPMDDDWQKILHMGAHCEANNSSPGWRQLDIKKQLEAARYHEEVDITKAISEARKLKYVSSISRGVYSITPSGWDYLVRTLDLDL
jgi:hypothetical protein